MTDISIREELLGYLADKGVFCNTRDLYVRYFTGGVSATVALVSDGKRPIIVKQALAKLKVADNWECDQSRMIIEKNALDIYARLVPSATPAPISYDKENYILIREAAPENCPMWKTNLLEGLFDYEVAKEAIEAIAAIHNGTAGDKSVAETFGDGSFFYSLRISPYIQWVAAKYPRLEDASREITSMLMENHLALIHGDYSPKNILVDGRGVCVLDLEVAYYGHPCFDLAFFANHFLLKTVKNKQYGNAYLEMLRYMLHIYFERLTFLEKTKMESDTVRTLAFLFLARVDGKSPAEYITLETDKDIIRRTAMKAIENGTDTFENFIALLQENLS